MAIQKITADVISSDAITTASISDSAITAAKLAGTLDLTGKTVTVATASAGDNDTTVASTAFVSTAIANLADSAPSTLDTLNELAAALGDDANFSTTVTNSIATKLPLAGGALTGNLSIGDSSSRSFALYVENAGSAGAGQIMLVDSDNDTLQREIRTDAGVLSFDYWDSSNRSNHLTILANGNVGIGTTSPSAKLELYENVENVVSQITNNDGNFQLQKYQDDIYFNLNDNGNYIFRNYGSSGSSIAERMRIRETGAIEITGSSTTSQAQAFITNDNSVLTIGSSVSGSVVKDIAFNSPSTMMYIDGSSGNVGIGTTAPITAIHAGTSGGNSYSSTITKGSNMKGGVFTQASNNDDMVGVYFATGSTTAGTHWSGITGSRSNNAAHWGTQLNFYTHANDVANLNDATQKMVIKGNGNVGIGTTSPSGSLHLTTVDSGGADVHYVAQNTSASRIAGYKILDESGNNQVSLTYDNGSNRGNLNLGQADGEILYVYGGSSVKSGFGIDLSGSSRELSIFHTSSGTDGNIALGKRLESNGTFYETVQVTPAGTAGTANLIVHNVNSNAFNHVQENKVPNLTAGEDVFLGLGKATSSKNMGYLGYEWNASGSDNNYIHLSHWGADGLFRVYGNGNYSFSGSNISDRDLKENIVAITDTALDKVTQLVVKKFNFIKDYEVSSDGTEVETPRTQVGFIAQEVEAIIPDITVGTDGKKDMGVDTIGLVGYLTKAIQEQQTIIDDLKSRIETLEG